MTTILHIAASPVAAASRTRSVARHLIDGYRARHPGAALDEMDVWQQELPHFDAQMVAAKFAVLRSSEAGAQQRALWARAVALARRFNAADRYVFSVPMWNFGLPYRLKHFIDIVTLPGENWRWSRERGYEGLLHGKRAVVVYSSAGAHPLQVDPAGPDHQKGQMRAWLAFLGITDVHEINVAPTLAEPEAVERTVAQARATAQVLAAAL